MLKASLIAIAFAFLLTVLHPASLHADTTDFWGFKVNGWQKYPQPVLPREAGQWDSAWTREIAPVINDTDGTLTRGSGGQLTAYYGGVDSTDVRQVGKAISTDNGYTWTNRTVAIAPSGVVGSWYQSDVWQPTVIKRSSDGVLLMLSVGEQANDYTTDKIGAFISSDNGASWTDQGVQVTMNMFHYENGSPITQFGVPRVIKRSSGDYLLVLEGQTYNSSNWRIFAATSPTFTGSWTALNNGNPILLPGTASWENVGVANPQIIEVAPNSYVMAYNGQGTAPPNGWQIGFASSTDLINWYRNPGNPVIGPGTAAFDSKYVETSFLAKADSYGVAKLYIQGYDATGPQVGLATADWREFSTLFIGNDGLIYGRRLDGALLRASLPSTGQGYWEQIGSDWNQFQFIFNGMPTGDGSIYAVRSSDGALLRNKYIDGTGWQGWVQIGAGWNVFSKVFMGPDGWIYAVQSDGSLIKNQYVDGVGWQGWVQIGTGWNTFSQVYMGTDGWFYTVDSGPGSEFRKNKYTDGVGWQGWVQLGTGWSQFTQVFPGSGSDSWTYAKRNDGHLLKNNYVDGIGWQGWQEL